MVHLYFISLQMFQNVTSTIIHLSEIESYQRMVHNIIYSINLRLIWTSLCVLIIDWMLPVMSGVVDAEPSVCVQWSRKKLEMCLEMTSLWTFVPSMRMSWTSNGNTLSQNSGWNWIILFIDTFTVFFLDNLIGKSQAISSNCPCSV